MDKKIIFIDIDGTLIGKSQKVTDKNIEAIHKLRENGNYVFLSTGRPLSYIEKEIMDIGFDGVLASAGGAIYYNHEYIFTKPIAKDIVTWARNILDTYGFEYALETTGAYYCTKNLPAQTLASREGMKVNPVAYERFLHSFHQIQYAPIEDYPEELPVVKLSGSYDDPGIGIHLQELEEHFKVVPYGFGVCGMDIIQKEWNKGLAAKYLLDYLNIPVENSYAYGDSMNDSEILEFVAHPYACTYSCKELLDICEDTFDEPDHDGLYKSFKKNLLI